jgi:hypothetical protein
MAPDPFEGPDNTPNPDRNRPVFPAQYDGTCGVCGIEFEEGEEIRITADGQGQEVAAHDHDPEDSMPSDPRPVTAGERVVLPPPPEGLYGDPETAPEQFTCPECPKSFAPTKDKLVRTHKNALTQERCPGSRAVPVELAEPVTPVPAAPTKPFLDGSRPTPLLDRAAELSPTVAAMKERLATGGPSTSPLVPSPATTTFPGVAAAPPEDAPDAAEVMYNRVNGLDQEDDERDLVTAFVQGQQQEELAPEGVTLVVTTVPPQEPGGLANADLDRAALYAHRPAEPEPTAENGGREPLYGRYVLPNPKTGKGKTWRRATTFASQLDDTYNLDAWQKRHLVRGAAMAAAQDPVKLAAAARWDVRQDKQVLNDLAEALMTESGVHTAAEQGTLVHTLTEAVDRASTADQDADAWYAVPEHYAADVMAYRKALETYGLRVVPSLLERRTAVVEYGVAGTFDQVTEVVELQNWSRQEGLNLGDFLVTDKKTGSDMSYGTGTHGIQLWLYAHGINTSGVWDDFAKAWTHPVRVREDVGVIVHIPLEQGKCTLHSLNLERGREGAVLVQQGYDRQRALKSQALRFSRPIGTVTASMPTAVPVQSPTPQESPVQQPAQQQDPMADWLVQAGQVTTEQGAYSLYQAAVDAGMPAALLSGFQTTLQERLRTAHLPAQPAPVSTPQPVPSADPMVPWYAQAEGVQSRQHADWLMGQARTAGMPEAEQRELAAVVESWLVSNTDTDATPAAPVPAGPPHWNDPQWDAWARSVTTKEQAGSLFAAAQQAPGMPQERLQGLTSVMHSALADQPPF